ncbi:fimbria/pilus periplasmic chaperone [Aeromonas veronii]|uniref:fimbrial biogenesis chaperone n=1 Tax=Aeromonas veronii TaxID=654 RepID=UPI0031FC3A62
MKFILLFVLFNIFSVLNISEANAAGLPQTRFIYQEKSGPASVVIVNPDPHEVLIQVYVDSKDSVSSNIRVYPSVFTLPANGRRIVKIYGLNNFLLDREESIRYLHVATIPPEGDKGSALKMVVNARYKMMLRPNNMANGKLEEAVNALKVSCDGSDCFLVNSSPFNIVLSELEVNGRNVEVDYIAPNKKILVSKGTPKTIIGKYINDNGDYIPLPRFSF